MQTPNNALAVRLAEAVTAGDIVRPFMVQPCINLANVNASTALPAGEQAYNFEHARISGPEGQPTVVSPTRCGPHCLRQQLSVCMHFRPNIHMLSRMKVLVFCVLALNHTHRSMRQASTLNPFIRASVRAWQN